MTTKHTPGPWEVRYDDQLDHIFTVGEHPRRIANIFGGVCGQNDSDLENQANARLVAAAPDLLAACKRYLRAMDEYGHPDKTDRLMRAAIEKATGEAM